MLILCIFNGIIFIVSLVLNIWVSSIRNTVENNGDEIIDQLLEKDIEEQTAKLAIQSLVTKLKTWTYGLYVVGGVCSINFVICALLWLNILSI